MHDLDRTLSTLDPETDFEAEFDDEAEDDLDDDMLGEGFDDELGFEGESNELEALRTGRPFSEDEEIELATELLAVQSEEELEMFVEGLFSRLRKRFKKFRRRFRKIGRRLRPFVKKLARRALPIAGRIAGGFFGGPAGAAIGGRVARGAGRIFGLELEGLAPEDQELEVARRVVRFAGLAAANAAQLPEGGDDERGLRDALGAAARTAAPGLLRGARGRARRLSRSLTSGRWVRRGRNILVMGA